MQIPLLDLKAQYAGIRDELRAAVDGVLERQRFILGEEVAALESEIAALCGVPHAVGVASGSDALMLALRALEVGPGHAVVTVPYTFFATAGAIVHLGAHPVFVDIDPASFNLSVEQLSRFFVHECTYNVSARRLVHARSGAAVVAVVPVHLFGQCCDIGEIVELAARHGLAVVEDACQAIGARYGDGAAGSFGDAAAFSFFPSKNLGAAGDGGMVVTRRADVADRVRLLREHGARPKYLHATAGYNSRLDELQAAILRVKLRHLPGWNAARARNAAAYGRDFGVPELGGWLQPPAVLPGRSHVFNQYVIRCRERDALRAFLGERGIGTEIYYPRSLHMQECFAGLGYGARDFPQSTSAAERSLALPVYPELGAAEREAVRDAVLEFHAGRRSR
jgi:dTDP-4-amino-4,6-dideoxygalactose transaminase